MRRSVVVLAAMLFFPTAGGAAPFLYVPDCTDEGCSALAVVDTATNTVLQHLELTHPDGEAFPPWAVRVNSAGTRVWVTSGYGNGLAIVDTATQSQVGFVDLIGDGPGGVAVDAAETRAWIPMDGGSIHVVDLVNETPLVEDFFAGDDPVGVVLHPDGSRLYVSTDEGSGIQIVDPDTLAVENEIPADALEGIAIDRCGTRVYAVDATNQTLLVVDTATDALVTSVPLPSGALFDVAVRPDGSTVYVTDFDGQVHAIDTTSFAVTTVAVGAELWGVSVHPSGSPVYVVKDDPGDGGSVLVLDADTLATIDVVTGLNQPSGAGGQMIQAPPPCVPPVDATGKCHAAKQSGSFARQTVGLTDALDAKQTNVNGVDSLCNAVEGAGAPTGRLCYRISDVRGQARRVPSEEGVTDEFGTLALLVAGAQSLCMPVEGTGGSFKCYKAKQKAGTPRFVQRSVTATDAFGTATLRLKKPVALCVATSIDGAPVADPSARKVCYRSSEAPGTPKFPGASVLVTDDFGPHALAVKSPRLYCVPAS